MIKELDKEIKDCVDDIVKLASDFNPKQKLSLCSDFNKRVESMRTSRAMFVKSGRHEDVAWADKLIETFESSITALKDDK